MLKKWECIFVSEIMRINEDEDFEHGKRSVEIAKEMVENKIMTSPDENQLRKLYYALRASL